MTGRIHVGGLVGYAQGNNMENCFALDSSIKGKYNVGGLVGWSNNMGIIKGSNSLAKVAGHMYVGGLVGYIQEGGIFSSSVSDSVPVAGNHFVGGLVGWVDQSKIDNCYSVAKVVGSNGVGGLVGSTHSPFDKLSSCYFAGTVSSNDAVEKSNFGSLVGDPNGLTEPIVNDCVYLDTSLKETSYGVTEFGKAVSNANMKQIATYQKGSSFLDDSNSEWDIVSDYDENHIWFIIEGKTYPLLSYYVLPSESGGNGFGSANIVSSVSEIPGFTDNTDNNPETPNENQEEDIKIVDGNSKLALVLFNRSRTHSHHRRNCLLFDSKKK